ncbi:uncharacterized protein LOC120208665 isoform X2 [Hibiscus syriacus]|uniref:uncharacterized protein LOC120208665 isoform X2 n=1 Tax=Hibiscus syriacus TaxID=106335 RepID=UPI001921DA64|nr:uncharacterized protein LOC120208665 isoform X2 [Hibiscus syriacus]
MASEELLKPFYQRAIEAEERLSRLEAVLVGNKDAAKQEPSQLITELQAKLEAANAEALSEREKAKQLAMENEKHKYRISHLVRAVKEADQKLECMKGHVSEATEQTSSKLEAMRL